VVVRELAVKLGLDVDQASFAKGKAAADALSGVLTKAVVGGNLIAKAIGVAMNLAANAVRGLDDALIGFNARAEQAKMGLAGIAGMNLKLPWEEAKAAADELYRGLQEDAAKTPAETSELVEFSQQIAGAYLAAGKNMKDLRQFTTQAVVAAKMLKAEGTAATDIKQAIQGRVGVKDMFASNIVKSLGMTNEEFNKKTMQERADLFAKGLNNPTIRAAMAEYETQWDGVTSTIKDNIAIALGEVGKPLFEFFKKNLIDLGKWIIKNKGDFIKWGKVIITDLIAITSLVVNVVKWIGVSWVDGFNKMGSAGKIAIGIIAVALVALMSPFTAIVAAVSAVMLLFDDIRGYFAGEDSLTGDFIEFINSWLVTKPGDSWFVAEIKAFLRILNDASKDLFEFGKKVVAQFKYIADVMKYLPIVAIPRLAIKAGGAIGDFAADGRQRLADATYHATNPYQRSSEEAREAFFRGPQPESRTSGTMAPGSGVLLQAPVNINVTQLPGESGEAFSERFNTFFDERYNNHVLAPAVAQVKR
jgi:hypothetical protein